MSRGGMNYFVRNCMENLDDRTEQNHMENPDDCTDRNHIEFFYSLDADDPWSQWFLRAFASHLSDRTFDWKLVIRYFLPASQVPWLTDSASECEMTKHSTPIQCSDFQLRNLAVLCVEIKEVALYKPLSLGHLAFCLAVLFIFGIILRFNFSPRPRAKI